MGLGNLWGWRPEICGAGAHGSMGLEVWDVWGWGCVGL